MKTNMELTQLDTWKAKWQEFFATETFGLMSHKSLSTEKKIERFEFLNSVAKIMDNVLSDLYEIRYVFDNMYINEIVFHGVKNLFGEGFEFKECFGNDKGIVKFYNENHQLIFDPFVLEDIMKAEFIATSNADFFFTINIYEDEPERIDFYLEYSTPEDEERFKKLQRALEIKF
ncbi:hypothetical protein COM54_22110 [Bacillus toyonensis]|uniref:hypothetical protein n=1 Tax=Bacillus toyonensis TaxID=155322 RepID=UPI000BF63310|nr:hypothetical protein [Bacillus toyonensis]PGE07857.1 hypothetical protein COM54_22110 [Bacillus toyonensis]